MTERIERIIAMEWEMFDKVQNRGGRAPCQDDHGTFQIMRSSQLMAWNIPMQESYFNDLLEAQKQGRNLLSEKYAYMMERTSPLEYAVIKEKLPPRDAKKDSMIDQICRTHVVWLEALSERYPRLTGNGRVIRKKGDGLYSASFETYLWGELATYSLKTVKRYAAYLEQLQKEGRNLNEMILRNMVERYGFASLEAAENRLAGQ